jgi:hypothetical protein
VILQPIVEGHGEVDAIPSLLHRVCADLGVPQVRVARPILGRRTQIVKESGLRDRVEIARQRPNLGGILVLFDAYDDCPKTLARQVTTWARRAAAPIPCEVVIAMREFEAWFLGGIEGLRGVAGFPRDLEPPRDPEAIQDAKAPNLMTAFAYNVDRLKRLGRSTCVRRGALPFVSTPAERASFDPRRCGLIRFPVARAVAPRRESGRREPVRGGRALKRAPGTKRPPASVSEKPAAK